MSQKLGLINYRIAYDDGKQYDGKQYDSIQIINGKTTFNVFAKIYNTMVNSNGFNVYFLITDSISNETLVAQQAHVDNVSDDNTYSFKFDIETENILTEDIKISISVSHKNPGEMGISESIRAGNILTFSPVVKVKE